ncbi:MAG: prepilin-type N-terminal cleavage/methylation domain-containing protein [Candidatus Pacebacteria bacterium]|nr:prepilin-type N-terminal cleavage/methylation domain-containing protein [Candidatus Paceibacterota bacterium]
MHQLIKNAFTLIELLVVIAIIGILSGLIVVTMNGVTAKANIAKSQVFSNSLRNALMLNLVSEWNFDGSGKNDGEVADASYVQDIWAGNNGTISGTPLVRKGNNCISGSCLEFNGSTDYLSTTSTITLSPTTGYSVSFWANLQAKSVEGSMPIGDLLSQTKSYIWFYNSGTTIKITGTGEVTIVSGTVPNVYNGWNYWTFTYSGSTAYLYRNASIVLTNLSAPSLVFGISRIGMAYSSSYVTKGKLDDMRVFSSSVPTSYIRDQYYSGLNSLLGTGQIDENEYFQKIFLLASK